MAAVRISSRGGGPRPRERGGGIRRATGPPGGGVSRCSVAVVSRLLQRHRVFVSKVKHLFFSKLVVAVGTGKKYRRRKIVENKQLFRPF